jgi:hypothetical protein
MIEIAFKQYLPSQVQSFVYGLRLLASTGKRQPMGLVKKKKRRRKRENGFIACWAH